MPVVSLCSTTLAPGTTAPVLSATTPCTRPRVSCAYAAAEPDTTSKAERQLLARISASCDWSDNYIHRLKPRQNHFFKDLRNAFEAMRPAGTNGPTCVSCPMT